MEIRDIENFIKLNKMNYCVEMFDEDSLDIIIYTPDKKYYLSILPRKHSSPLFMTCELEFWGTKSKLEDINKIVVFLKGVQNGEC